MGKKSIIFSLLLSILVLLTVSCGNDGNPPAPGTLQLVNDSTVFIDEFYLAPVNDPSWGADQLSSSVAAGTSRDIVNVPPGTYDAMATYFGALSIYDAFAYDLPITSGNTTFLVTVDTSFTGSLKIVNNSGTGLSIFELYIVPSTSGTWGSNLITGSIGVGGSIHYTDVPPDNYDVRVVWSNSSASEVYDRAVSSLALTTITLP